MNEKLEQKIELILFNITAVILNALIGTFSAVGVFVYFLPEAKSVFELVFISIFIGAAITSILTFTEAENWVRGKVLEDYEVELVND